MVLYSDLRPLAFLLVLFYFPHNGASDRGALAQQPMELIGEGSHRTLVYHLSFLSDLARERCMGELPMEKHAMRDQDHEPAASFSFTMLQRLPIELFVDPNELSDIERRMSSAEHESGGVIGRVSFNLVISPSSVDLELPSPALNETIALLLRFKSADLAHLSLPLLQIPLHARYPSPQQCHHRSLISGWFASSHVCVVVDPPSMWVGCRGGQIEVDWKEEGVDWLIPAGCLDHEPLVSWGTLIVSIVTASSIAWSVKNGPVKMPYS